MKVQTLLQSGGWRVVWQFPTCGVCFVHVVYATVCVEYLLYKAGPLINFLRDVAGPEDVVGFYCLYRNLGVSNYAVCSSRHVYRFLYSLFNFPLYFLLHPFSFSFLFFCVCKWWCGKPYLADMSWWKYARISVSGMLPISTSCRLVEGGRLVIIYAKLFTATVPNPLTTMYSRSPLICFWENHGKTMCHLLMGETGATTHALREAAFEATQRVK